MQLGRVTHSLMQLEAQSCNVTAQGSRGTPYFCACVVVCTPLLFQRDLAGVLPVYVKDADWGSGVGLGEGELGDEAGCCVENATREKRTNRR